MFARRSIPALAAVLAALFILAGCAGAAAAPQANIGAFALRVSGAGDRQAMLDYLQAAQEDFTVVDTLLGDKDLGLLEEDTSSNEEITSELIDKYLGILDGYDTRVGAQLQELKTRDAPDNPDIAFFKEAELREFETTADIVDEYIQVLKYAGSLLTMGGEMNQLGNVDTSDLEGTYQTFNTVLGKAIDELKAEDVPSFLKSMNDDFITALGELNDAVLYALQAASINDPVRANSAEYRLGMLTRKIDKISGEAQQDMTDREAKLKTDLKGIKTENDGLRNWVQKNIDKLNGN
jgi:hypothetical protein